MVGPENGFVPESLAINDYEDVYKDMPDSRSEVCIVERNEVTRMVMLKGICCVTFEKEGRECPAWVAIEASLADNPRNLYSGLLHAVDNR